MEEVHQGISRRTFLFRTGCAVLVSAVTPSLAKPEHYTLFDPGVAVNKLQCTINGKAHSLTLDTRVTLLDLLREKLELTGSKKGCDRGQCGACTVLVNDRRVNACLTLAATCEGADIVTIEGLADGNELHPMQAAFIKHDAFQCGYCTPGQICSAVGLIKEAHVASDEDIRELMSGNICRCGAYQNILHAIKEVNQSEVNQ